MVVAKVVARLDCNFGLVYSSIRATRNVGVNAIPPTDHVVHYCGVCQMEEHGKSEKQLGVPAYWGPNESQPLGGGACGSIRQDCL
jgi:hypothetical protein